MIRTQLGLLLLIFLTTFLHTPPVAAQDTESRLRHVVLFAFKEGATEAQIADVEAAFAALPQKIETIADFEWGKNNSPEGLNDGLTHCFFLTFANEQGRAEYLPHPAHKEFVAKLKPVLQRAVVVDYWAKKDADQ